MRDSLKKISVMRDRYLPFATLSKGLIMLPKMFTIAKSENSQDVETYGISATKRPRSAVISALPRNKRQLPGPKYQTSTPPLLRHFL